MDYEKKYKEALNWMRSIYSTLAGSDKEYAEHYFPELKDSDDERIRKEIIHYILYKAKDISEEQEHTWVAYLEKQKEPIPIPDKFSGLKSLMLQYLQSAANRKDDTEIMSDTDLWGRKILDYIWKYDEKQKEQKKSLSEKFRPDFPTVADFIESVDGQEKARAIEILEDYLKWAVSESEEDCSYTWNELANAIKLGICAMKEQKPNIELIQKSWYMEGYHDRKFNNEPKWIIKTGEGGPRYEENPKYGQLIEEKPAEWSKEDKERIQRIHDFMWKNRKGDTDTIYQIEKDADWLESLRNRVGKEFLQPHWKPSEEQMKALWDAYKGGKEQEPLRELIEQLKKL